MGNLDYSQNKNSITEATVKRIVQEEIKRSQSGGRFGMNQIPFHTHDGVNSQKIKEENIIPSVSVSGNIEFAREDTYTIYLNSSFTPSNIQLYGVAYSITGTLTFTADRPSSVVAGTIYDVEDSSGVSTGIRVTVSTTAVGTTSIVTTGGLLPPPTTGILDRLVGSGDGSITYTSVSDGTTLGVRCQIIGSANLGPSFYLQPGSNSAVVTGNIQYPFIDPVLETTVPLQSNSYIWTQSSNIFRALSGEFHIVNVQGGSTIYARATVTEFNKEKIVIVVSDLEPNWTIAANIVIT